MKNVLCYIKIKNTKLIFLFFIIFITVTALYIFSECNNKEKIDDNAAVKENYIIIDKKKYDYNNFNSFLLGDENTNDELNFNVEEVKEVLYVGDGGKINPSIFSVFPNVEHIIVRKCILENIEIGMELESLKELELKKCVIKGIYIYSDSLEVLTLDYSKIEDIKVKLPGLMSLVINYNNITEELLAEFSNCKNIRRMSFIGSQLPDIQMLNSFRKVSCLRLQEAKTSGFDKLKCFIDLNEIYLDKNVDRSNIDFMYDNFKNGDIDTRAYFAKKRHNLN